MKYLLIVVAAVFAGNLVAQNAPAKTFSENIAGTAIANDVSGNASTSSGGDLNLTVPLVTVQSRTMSFPLELIYSSGITVDQQSGPVGLGWVMPIGSIVRDYGAFEPDYTSTSSEINMENRNGGNDGWLHFDETENIQINPSVNNQDLTYEVTSDLGYGGNGVPDNYHVSVPGFFSNTFFNGADEDAHQWIFHNDVPYLVNHEVKNYEISQEFSRINEANLGSTNFDNAEDKEVFIKTGSYAAAITVPPYASGAYVWNPGSESTGFNPTGDDRLVKYDDFESFTITDDNGYKFVFGRALRGQKYLISEDPYWSTINYDAAAFNTSYSSEGNFWKIDYIAEWLLTEILSPDYVDENENGIADDGDLGDWIRFEYTEPVKMEATKLLGAGADVMLEVPMYREWTNFSQTDRASSLMMEKAYLTKIITPTQELDFTISQRFEVDHDYFDKPANKVGNEFFYEDRKFDLYGNAADFDVSYPIETMKYDEIKVIDKSRDYTLYATDSPTLALIKLTYAEKGSEDELAVSNYLIRDNDDQSRGIDPPSEGVDAEIGDYYTEDGRGKTTLLGVTLYSSTLSEDDKQEYEFEYENNPSYSEIHKREIVRSKMFPSIRQSNWDGSTLFDPVALNEISYFTEDDPLTPFEVSPFEFLIDIPYQEYHEMVSGVSDYEEILTYLDTDVLPLTATIISVPIDHELYAVKDVFNYAVLPNGELNSDAWSLTKVTYPTGGTLEFEYEFDEFNLSEDESEWAIPSDGIPLIAEYNDLAKMRSKYQSLANLFNVGTYKKKLYANLVIDLPSEGGGVRLKSETINDGINTPVVIEYEYGDGHFSALPSVYVQNCYSAFNSFISIERDRHSEEHLKYSFEYSLDPLFVKNDFDTKMRYFAFTDVTVESANSTHFYEFIDKVYANGAKNRRHFGTLKFGEPFHYDSHTILYSRDIISNGRAKFVYASQFSALSGIDLVKIEEFENGNIVPYSSQEFEYEIFNDLYYDISSGKFPSTGTYDNLFEIYVTLGDSPYDPYYYKNDVFDGYTTTVYQVGHGAIALTDLIGFSFGALWEDMPGTDFAQALVNLVPVVPSYELTISAEDLKKWGTFRKRMVEVSEENRGMEQTTIYTYEPTHGYTQLIENSTTNGNVVITEYGYAFEEYDGLTDAFEDANMFTGVARNTVYLNTVDEANALQATFTTWDYSGAYPKPELSFTYNTSTLNHTTGEFTVNPFTITGSNVSEWQQIEKEPLNYNTDGSLTLVRENETYVKTVVGYNRGNSKATIVSIDGEFDGTYSGFEDLTVPLDIPIGSLPYAEYWYYQDLTEGEKVVVADINASFTNPCGNSLMVDDDPDIFLTVVIESNADINGQIFFIGDEISLNGVDGTSTPMTEFVSTITGITTLINGDIRLCLADPLTSEYETVYWTAVSADFPGDYTISKEASVSPSGPSKSYQRTGEYSYKLTPKSSGGDIARKTPVRPVIPPDNSQMTYAEECYVTEGEMDDPDRGYYPSECYISYEASVWVKHDFDVPRLAAINSPQNAQLYTTGANGGFVTSKPVLTSEDYVNTYLRGTTSATMDVYDVKLVYKLWNSTRTILVDEGEFYLEDLTSQWKQYTIEIPLFRGAENQQLDVYVESNIVDNNSFSTKKSIYVDDLVIYPKGAEYAYLSMDKFKNPTHSTNNNDVFVSQSSDKWGRLSKVWNAYGQQTQSNDYVISNDPLVSNSSTVTTFTGTNKYFKTRTYTDGFNKQKQIIVSDPATNKRIVTSTIDYDDMGRAVKSYKSYSLNGLILASKYDQNYSTKTADLYESSHAFGAVEYFETLEQLPVKNIKPRENAETEMATTTSIYETTTSVGGSYGIPTYVAGELVVTEITDAEGFISRSYSDDLGRMILQEREFGFEYEDNPDGSISFTATEKPFQQTWFLYDEAGRLIKSIDPSEKVTEYYYNSIGQLVKSIEPDRGMKELRYNKFGQLRFEQSSKDAAVANTSGYIDQFKYVKYDKWGRVIANGVMREMSDQNITNSLSEVYTATDKFNNQTLINDQSYPVAGIMFNQINTEYVFDGTRSAYDSRSLLSEKVYSGHTQNGNYQFIPGTTDETSYQYLLDGRVKSVIYDFDEFTDPHVFNFEYTRFGEVLKKTYLSPIDPVYNYTWEYKYDNFGRPIESLSGNPNDFKSNGTNYYDALGNLYKVGIGKTTDPLNPHIDYVVSKLNIRDRLTSQMSLNFRFGLSYNKNEQITDQYWSSEHFDPTDGGTVSLNHYKYYYDGSNRLIGADYRTQEFGYNPFAYFADLAPTENNEFDCTYNVETAVVAAQGLADEVSSPGGGIVLGEAQKQRALDGLEFVKDEYLKSGLDWDRLSETQQDQFLGDLIILAGKMNIDLKAYEEVKARIENDTKHLLDLQLDHEMVETEWKITGKSSVSAVRTYTTLTPAKMKYTKAALHLMVYSLMKCETNLDATVYGFLPDFDISGTETNVSIYDAAYWYEANGNTSLLHRKDNTTPTGIMTTQIYNYDVPGSNLLNSVDWSGGVTGNKTYSYDVLGNLTFDQQNDNTISYDYFTDLPVSMANTLIGTMTYRYSASGVRTVKTIDGDTEYYLDGVILAEDESVNSYQTATGYATPSGGGEIDFYHVIKDWLGTARLTIDDQEDPLISAARDHYPYGKIMPGRAFETDVEGKRYQFTGHEYDNEVNYEYHGARYYNRELGRYLSVDPLASKYLSWSPYVYTMDNPVLFTDPEGKEVENDYGIDRDGNVTFVKITDDKFDRLYATDEQGNITDPNKYVTISDQTILPELANKRTIMVPNPNDYESDPIDSGRKFRSVTSKSKEDIVNLFVFLGDNYRFEVVIYATKDGNYSLGTSEATHHSPNYKTFGIELADIVAMIHTHPNSTEADEIESLGPDPSVDPGATSDRSIATTWAETMEYYSYIPVSDHLYQINSDGTYKAKGVVTAEMILKMLK